MSLEIGRVFPESTEVEIRAALTMIMDISIHLLDTKLSYVLEECNITPDYEKYDEAILESFKEGVRLNGLNIPKSYTDKRLLEIIKEEREAKVLPFIKSRFNNEVKIIIQ